MTQKGNLVSVKTLFAICSFILTAGLIAACFSGPKALALDNNFADGITVDSKLDTSDASIGDTICDDGAGNCTLRAAMEESNATAGAQSILFNISGPADFSNGGQNGYSIQPTYALPSITDSLEIDGYSQSGALANTAISPQPLNGRLLIEVNGTAAGTAFNFNGFEIGADDVTIRGLVINNWSYSGIGASTGDNIVIAGNYIGVDPLGASAQPNRNNGIDCWGGVALNGFIGGINPADRNIISGNSSPTFPQSGGIGLGNGHDGWTIQGNYIGLGADGITAIPNAQPGGSGSPSVDFVNGTLIGGYSVGATNVISGNNGHGIAPHDAPNTQIIGNFIGTDYTGTQPLGNDGGGVTVSGVSHNSSIIQNIIADSGLDGIFIQNINNATITGNFIGTDSSATLSYGNQQDGINVDNSTGIIGGLSGNEQNVIYNNTGSGIRAYNNSQISFIRNNIYNNGFLGIDIESSGPALNDVLDGDTGTNDVLNFPEYTNMIEASGDTTVAYRLDVPTGNYRIEFYSNTAPDGSGRGEGEVYLGYQDISHAGGGVVNFSHTLTGVTGVTNLAMTTTERNMPTPNTFGATSEFGSFTLPSSDLGLTHVLLTPQGVAQGATLSYQIAIKNNGPDPFDLSKFTMAAPGTSNMVTLIMPPDITYAGNISDPNVSCTSLGPGSAVIFGSSLGSHSDHEIVLCWWSGPSQLLSVGDTFNFNYDVTVQPTSDLVFTDYALIPPSPSSDPDLASIGIIYSSGQDILDQLSQTTINNFASARYPIPVILSSQSVSVVTSSLLANTGIYILPMIGIGIFLIVLSIASYLWSRLSHKKVDKTL